MAHCNGTGPADHEMQPVYGSSCEGESESLEIFQLRSGFILDSERVQDKMEVDLELQPNTENTDSSILRRSSSAPMINGLGDNSQVFQDEAIRIRRNSSTFMSQQCLLFPPPSISTSLSRVHQIKQEESMDLIDRETLHEQEVQTAIQISQSWEKCLNLNDNDLEKPLSLKCIDLISVLPVVSPSQGIEKQCFSPSLRTSVSCAGFPPSPSPSPSQQNAISSHNPTNIVRPSILGPIKRKGELTLEEPPKKIFIVTSNIPSDISQLSEEDLWEKR
ncbi:P2R1A-PPP2R2A-interacting phosphatase regulator 1 isoform X1 [Oryctolagus cuniculus]|uniref:P2R1A-PPP2R2A-interacting phosphatase regulator 1 isoform X1 n=1 Tax=Oryctolagus cuniculus TaxID=9986 RepID=UPI0003904F84|nr:P2R1A-PPP2R2A-interacting phosphatase regulator 1 isoform X1 [Oryctolagus cuniculus]